MRILVLFCYIILIASVSASAALKDVPAKVNPKAHYLFYLHGKILEDQGIKARHPNYGFYDYDKILQTLEQRGFTVISEMRERGTDPAQYAAKVIKQIQALLAAGVPPSQISVIGASKGGVIAELVSAGLKDSKARFVLLGSCNPAIEKNYHPDLAGEILSIYEESDQHGLSCKNMFAHSTGITKSDEIELHLNTEHGFLFHPLKEWVDPAVQWCLRPE
jgi:dienelactone hydrolase